MVQHLARDLTSVDTIEVTIAPGNDEPRGPAVTRAILSYVGKPIPRRVRGRWTSVNAWQGLRCKTIGSLGRW